MSAANTPDSLMVVRICDEAGVLLAPDWLALAEGVHRQLRPQLPYDYARKMLKVFAGGGRMALVTDGNQVFGLAVWRVFENTFEGCKFYVDDLVTDEAHRSIGVGEAMMAFLEDEAKKAGAQSLVLDSGTQRTRAHRFYFREGFVITAFNFKKQLV
ncbi:MAG: GNAT family N-acetyltransferase [Uliginosibacterium sp.]|nr:GNAT family N-acetyltransferase [Uliginosibacterium sp.]